MFRVMDERKYIQNWSDFNMVLQCTNENFYNRIYSLFKPGMNWNNYGTEKDQWALEYIIPLDHFYNNYNPLKIFINERYEKITIEDMCICINVQPVWNNKIKLQKIIPSYEEVIKMCYQIINYKDELYPSLSRSSSSSSLYKINEYDSNRNSLDQ